MGKEKTENENRKKQPETPYRRQRMRDGAQQPQIFFQAA
jgi:hypothetical protein